VINVLIGGVLALAWAAAVGWGADRRAVVLAVLAGTIGLLYWPALGYGFILDDFFFAQPVTATQLLSTLWSNWHPGGLGNAQYRPVIALVLAIDYGLWGTRTWGYHLTSLLVMLAAGLLAFELLRRLSGSARAGLAGALAWIAHPMSTSVAGWCAEKTDSVMAAFYVAALLALTHSPWNRRWLAATMALGALTLGSKEMAVTLPLVAGAVVLLGTEDWRRRLPAVVILAALTGLFVLWWIRLFPTKASLKLDQVGPLAPRLLIPVFAPTSYEHWWNNDPGTWIHLIVLLLAGGGVAWALWRRADQRPARTLALALLWPALAMIPIFGLRPPDVYRLGFLICFAFALVVAAVVAALDRRRWVQVGLVALLAVWFAPLARASVAVWGPGGFQYSLIIRWNLQDPGWDRQLTPEMQRVFRKQMRRHPP
jgi:hypothetical protein